MAYLFVGTKAKEASAHNDVIRIFNKKIAEEMTVDVKYSRQLNITFGLWNKEQTLETLISDQLTELEKIKKDIVRLYEEIYGKHVEKHNLINAYNVKIEESIEHIRQMCQEIDKELISKTEDLSNEFDMRINEIKEKLNAIINAKLDEATANNMEDLIEALTKLLDDITSDGHYEIDRSNHDLDNDSMVYVYGKDEPVAKDSEEAIPNGVNYEEIENQTNKILGEDGTNVEPEPVEPEPIEPEPTDDSNQLYFSIGTDEVTEDNFRTVNNSTPVTEYKVESSYNVDERKYVYVLAANNKTIELIDPMFNVEIECEDVEINIPNHKVVKTVSKVMGGIIVRII